GVELARSFVYERQITNCYVRVTPCHRQECLIADRGIEDKAGTRTIFTRLSTDGHVVCGGGGIERLETHGRVVIACHVVRKGSLPQGHVLVAVDVEDKGIFAYCRVETAQGIVPQCLSTQGRVVTPTGGVLERESAES